jgi:hypothetical protein
MNGRQLDVQIKSVKGYTRREKRNQKAKAMNDRQCGSRCKDCWGKKLEICGQGQKES